jgi:hypothetical protein
MRDRSDLWGTQWFDCKEFVPCPSIDGFGRKRHLFDHSVKCTKASFIVIKYKEPVVAACWCGWTRGSSSSERALRVYWDFSRFLAGNIATLSLHGVLLVSARLLFTSKTKAIVRAFLSIMQIMLIWKIKESHIRWTITVVLIGSSPKMAINLQLSVSWSRIYTPVESEPIDDGLTWLSNLKIPLFLHFVMHWALASVRIMKLNFLS